LDIYRRPKTNYAGILETTWRTNTRAFLFFGGLEAISPRSLKYARVVCFWSSVDVQVWTLLSSLIIGDCFVGLGSFIVSVWIRSCFFRRRVISCSISKSVQRIRSKYVECLHVILNIESYNFLSCTCTSACTENSAAGGALRFWIGTAASFNMIHSWKQLARQADPQFLFLSQWKGHWTPLIGLNDGGDVIYGSWNRSNCGIHLAGVSRQCLLYEYCILPQEEFNNQWWPDDP